MGRLGSDEFVVGHLDRVGERQLAEEGRAVSAATGVAHAVRVALEGSASPGRGDIGEDGPEAETQLAQVVGDVGLEHAHGGRPGGWVPEVFLIAEGHGRWVEGEKRKG